jgi:anti-sigma factor RsiW
MVAMGSCGSQGGASDIECRQIAELLGDYFDGSLPSHTRELIEFHMDGCAPCVAFVNTYRGTIAATRTLPETPMPAELKKRLLSVLREQRSSQIPPRS